MESGVEKVVTMLLEENYIKSAKFGWRGESCGSTKYNPVSVQMCCLCLLWHNWANISASPSIDDCTVSVRRWTQRWLCKAALVFVLPDEALTSSPSSMLAVAMAASSALTVGRSTSTVAAVVPMWRHWWKGAPTSTTTVFFQTSPPMPK